MMPSRTALLHGLCLATIVFALTYALVGLGPFYHPIEHVWRMQKLPNTPAMGWYARLAWSSLAALATLLTATPLLARRAALPASAQRALALITLITLTATLAWLAFGELTHAASQLATHS